MAPSSAICFLNCLCDIDLIVVQSSLGTILPKETVGAKHRIINFISRSSLPTKSVMGLSRFQHLEGKDISLPVVFMLEATAELACLFAVTTKGLDISFSLTGRPEDLIGVRSSFLVLRMCLSQGSTVHGPA